MTKRATVLMVYQILAGGVGVVCFLLPMAGVLSAGNAAGILLGIVAIAFSTLSIVAGILLGKQKNTGIGLTAFVQVAQLPILFISGFRYQLALLASLSLGFGEGLQVLFRYGLGANITVLLGDLSFQFIGVNLVPLTALLLLPGCLKKS